MSTYKVASKLRTFLIAPPYLKITGNCFWIWFSSFCDASNSYSFVINRSWISTHQYHCHFFTRFCDDPSTAKNTIFVLNIFCILFKNIFREIKVFVVSLSLKTFENFHTWRISHLGGCLIRPKHCSKNYLKLSPKSL